MMLGCVNRVGKLVIVVVGRDRGSIFFLYFRQLETHPTNRHHFDATDISVYTVVTDHGIGNEAFNEASGDNC